MGQKFKKQKTIKMWNIRKLKKEPWKSREDGFY